ncbi:MAG: hypothetical protein FWG64_01320 [Firmicutes bacterium]|nr:hypothetical protein [Bacillota bacterium]
MKKFFVKTFEISFATMGIIGGVALVAIVALFGYVIYMENVRDIANTDNVLTAEIAEITEISEILPLSNAEMQATGENTPTVEVRPPSWHNFYTIESYITAESPTITENVPTTEVNPSSWHILDTIESDITTESPTITENAPTAQIRIIQPKTDETAPSFRSNQEQFQVNFPQFDVSQIEIVTLVETMEQMYEIIGESQAFSNAENVSEEILDYFDNLDGFFVIDNDTIGNSGRSWVQPDFHAYADITISNTHHYPLRVTFREENGLPLFLLDIPVNESGRFLGFNMSGGQIISFSSVDGVVAGNITVKTLGE